jgi:L,D-transpeptidase catalytic domain
MLGQRPRQRHVTATIAAGVVMLASTALADTSTSTPPWGDADDVPLPSWARSVVPKRAEAAISPAPGKPDLHRGTILASARLPFYGAKRAAGCNGRWLLVGPLAWVCSDVAELSPEPPWSIQERTRWASAAAADGLPFRYFFVGRDGANGYADLEHALDSGADQEFEAGFSVAVVEERAMHGERWGKTNHGQWIAMRELAPAHPPSFHGEAIDGLLDLAWVTADRAPVRKGPRPDAAIVSTLLRFQLVHVKEEKGTGAAAMLRIGDDSASGGESGQERWVRARELSRATVQPPPPEVAADERWVDVDLASQTLVAFEGKRPVYATIVSTGRGATGSETATPKGVHRVWVKLATTNMDNLEKEDADRHFSIEDVPYVQFFDKGVALHAAFWHKDFGRVHSHGCVNLAPLDARFLFGWTLPHLPAGWSAVFPTPLEKGTAVRIR